MSPNSSSDDQLDAPRIDSEQKPNSLGDEDTPVVKSENSASDDAPAVVDAEVEPATGNVADDKAVGSSTSAVNPSETVADESTPARAPVLPIQPAKRPSGRKKWIILGSLIAALLVVIGGTSVFAYWYQRPEKVLFDALSSYVLQNYTQTNTVITSDSELAGSSSTSVKLKKLSFSSASSPIINSQNNASAIISVSGHDYTIGGKALVLDDATIYFQLNGLADAVKQIYKDYANGQSLTSSQLSALEKLQDKWVKITSSDMGDGAKDYKCSVDAAKKAFQNTDARKELIAVYEKHPFIAIDGAAQSKDGQFGYDVTLDRDIAKQFGTAFKETQLYKDLRQCDHDSSSSSSLGDDTDSTVDKAATEAKDNTDYKATIWVSQWSHQLKAITYTISYKNTSTDRTVKFEGRTDFTSTKTDIVAPSDSESFDDWKDDVEALTNSDDSNLSSIDSSSMYSGV